MTWEPRKRNTHTHTHRHTHRHTDTQTHTLSLSLSLPPPRPKIPAGDMRTTEGMKGSHPILSPTDVPSPGGQQRCGRGASVRSGMRTSSSALDSLIASLGTLIQCLPILSLLKLSQPPLPVLCLLCTPPVVTV